MGHKCSEFTPAVLNLVETRSERARAQTAELLAALSPAALGGEAPAHIVGITGPPGVGKSSLLSRLAAEWRRRGSSVAVLAVDPSSRRSGGALLGDRARLERDPSGVIEDLRKQIISDWTARNIYKVAYDPERHKVDVEKTRQLRDEERNARIARGKSYADFERDWNKLSPPQEILQYYGSWPDGKPTGPCIR